MTKEENDGLSEEWWSQWLGMFTTGLMINTVDDDDKRG